MVEQTPGRRTDADIVERRRAGERGNSDRSGQGAAPKSERRETAPFVDAFPWGFYSAVNRFVLRHPSR